MSYEMKNTLKALNTKTVHGPFTPLYKRKFPEE